MKIAPTKKRIVVADGCTGDFAEICREIPLSFRDVFVRLKYMVKKSLPYELIIRFPTLVDM